MDVRKSFICYSDPNIISFNTLADHDHDVQEKDDLILANPPL